MSVKPWEMVLHKVRRVPNDSAIVNSLRAANSLRVVVLVTGSEEGVFAEKSFF